MISYSSKFCYVLFLLFQHHVQSLFLRLLGSCFAAFFSSFSSSLLLLRKLQLKLLPVLVPMLLRSERPCYAHPAAFTPSLRSPRCVYAVTTLSPLAVRLKICQFWSGRSGRNFEPVQNFFPIWKNARSNPDLHTLLLRCFRSPYAFAALSRSARSGQIGVQIVIVERGLYTLQPHMSHIP